MCLLVKYNDLQLKNNLQYHAVYLFSTNCFQWTAQPACEAHRCTSDWTSLMHRVYGRFKYTRANLVHTRLDKSCSVSSSFSDKKIWLLCTTARPQIISDWPSLVWDFGKFWSAVLSLQSRHKTDVLRVDSIKTLDNTISPHSSCF